MTHHPIEFPRENASALRAVTGSSARKEKGVLKSTESALARKWRFYELKLILRNTAGADGKRDLEIVGVMQNLLSI
jgi:hypothetical protein